MEIRKLHDWNVPPREAFAIQRELRKKIRLENSFRTIGLLAGGDVAFDEKERTAFAVVVVFKFPSLEEVERKIAVRAVTFPYVSGLLAFREAPVLLDAIRLLTHEPDLFIFDGQGVAHPRGMGIASHLGLILEKPAIGCAKSRLCGRHDGPGKSAGSFSPLLSDAGETIGAVLRTRDGVKPVYVSPGHRIDLATSVEVILKTCDGTRIPKPARIADRYTKLAKTGKMHGGLPK